MNLEDVQAKAWQDLGLSQQLEVARTNIPNPSRGGSWGYPRHCREQMIAWYQTGQDIEASTQSVQHWIHHMQPYCMTGNKQRDKLVGFDQLLLVIFLYAFPNAEADEIGNESGSLYDWQTISNWMKELKISQKVASCEAYQAYTLQNCAHAWWFWTLPPPLGVTGVQHCQLIDVDEAGFELSCINWRQGYSATLIHIQKMGHYTRDTKLTMIMAIEPGDPIIPPHQIRSVQNPCHWIQVINSARMTAEEFVDFCSMICTNIEENPAGPHDNEQTFLWDNLLSHGSALVTHTVHGQNMIVGTPCIFSIIPHLPYQPKFGPIEYIFCEIACHLRQWGQPNWDTAKMAQEILTIMGQISCDGKFDATFDHCSY